MSAPDLADVVRYQEPKCIMVVGHKGQIRLVYTPFKVQAIEGVANIPIHSFLYVDAVYLHRTHILLYLVNQQLYPYHHFRINLNW